ncbi:MAG: tetratricopeptide repeat protein [Rhodocyclaceae bacterium]|nr:tetratricopeptide repeat protein [Rhodocyclaceae bacterium]
MARNRPPRSLSSGRYAPRLLATCVGGLLALVALIYAGALGNGFHFDDYINFVEVEAYHLDALSWRSLLQALDSAELTSRPLPNASLIIDWWRGQGSAVPFQQTNIAIHALCSVAVFAFIFQALHLAHPDDTRPRTTILVALAAGAMWAVHPIQVQAVTYIVQRMASMVALFYLVTAIAYVAARTSHSLSRGLAWGALCAAAAYCAFLSKENALMIPATLIVAEYGVCRLNGPIFRHPWDRYVWLLIALAAVYVVADLFYIEGPLRAKHSYAYIHRDFTMEERLLTQPRVLFFHLGQMAWPLPDRFSLEHGFVTSTGWLSPATTLPAIAGVALWLLCGFVALFSRRGRIAGYLLLFPLIALVPEGTFHGLEMVFEHRMYLPGVALFALVALAVRYLIEARPGLALPIAAIGLVVIALCAWSTIERLPAWRNGVTLGEANVRAAPRAPRAWLNYGIAQAQAGDAGNAGANMVRAVELGWQNRQVLDLAAPAMVSVSLRAEAIDVLMRLRAINQGTPVPRHELLLGDLLAECGRFGEARAAYARAQSVMPWDTTPAERMAALDGQPPSRPAQACEATFSIAPATSDSP